MTDPNHPRGPLAGVRVLDLTRVLAGPYCTMLLGDLGADVIKVERPGVGDDTRGWAPPFVNGESVYFLTVNRNKRSIVVDLSTDEGMALVRRLAGHADVIVENFRPGTMERLGLGYEELRQESPGVVYCSMTGYGNRGPRVNEPGYDALVIARGGLMSITGEPDGEPVRPGVALLDVAMGISAQGAICAALLARERTGVGQRIDTSLFATQIGTLVNAASNYLMAGQVMGRYGSGHPSIVPYQVFEASDGYVMIGAANETFWQRLCDVLEQPGLRDDPRFRTNADRVDHREELIPIVSSIVATRTVDEWLDRLGGADVPAAPINDIAQALEDPQVEALQLLTDVTHPTAGSIRLVGPMVEYGATPASIRRPPPRLGEHTDEVLEEVLGLDMAERTRLRSASIIE